MPEAVEKIRQLTLEHCLLLSAASKNDPDKVAKIYEKAIGLLNDLPAETDGQASVAEALRVRFNLINAILSNASESEIKSAIIDFANTTRRDWNHQPSEYAVQYSTLLEKADYQPSFQATEQVESADLQFQTRLGDTFQSIVQDSSNELNWCDPGLLMAGEIVFQLIGGARKETARHPVPCSTWIMFAFDHPDDPYGILARVSVTAVDGGCGLLVPDPFHCGYLSLDSKFSSGLQKAWEAARKFFSNNPADTRPRFNWRWSVDLFSATENTHPILQRAIQIPLAGPSAEVAFTAAMIAAHPNNPDNENGNFNPIDPTVAVTASLDPAQHGTLAGVGKLEIKTLLKHCKGVAKRGRLKEILIAGDPEKDPATEFDGFTFLPTKDLQSAYQSLCETSKITREVCKQIASKSQANIVKLCDPYVEPQLVEFGPQKLDGQQTEREKELGLRPKEHLIKELDGSDFQDFISGRYGLQDQQPSAPRMFVQGDSGLGKSILILTCEQAVSMSSEGILPVRIGRVMGTDFEEGGAFMGRDVSIDSIAWEARFESLVEELCATTVLSQAIESADLKNFDLAKRKKWFERLLISGSVVFLFDALDQVPSKIKGMGRAFSQPGLIQCPVIMTGRPEAKSDQQDSFEGNQWRMLRILEFDRPRQEEYLGEFAEQILLQDSDQSKIDYRGISEDNIRKINMKHLVGFPLLLKMLKQLASEKDEAGESRLKNIKNRFDLYDEAVNRLIQKGLDSLEDQQRKQFNDPKLVRRVLGGIAWYMAQRHEASAALNEQEMVNVEKWLKSRLPELGTDDSLAEVLRQVDVTTAWQAIERSNSGLEFRHRSFMEFFAGTYLQSSNEQLNDRGKPVASDAVSLEILEEVLQEIHFHIDDHGDPLPHILGGVDRRQMWNDTLRFALAVDDLQKRNQLAIKLIEYGNPWVVYQAIKLDKTEFSEDVDALCRWLVHRDWSIHFDYRDAISGEKAEVKEKAKEVAAGLGNALSDLRRYDSGFLSTWREILPPDKGLYVGISNESKLTDKLTRLSAGLETWNFFDSFIPLQGGVFDAPKFYEDLPIGQQQIQPFEMAHFPVTNELYELFCPRHHLLRDQYSWAEDAPAIYVNWYMATEFCHWLSSLTGDRYRLPTEWQWEWAVRWHEDPERQANDSKKNDYWWGPEMDNRRCFYRENSLFDEIRRPPTLTETLRQYSDPNLRHPSSCENHQFGLLSLSGTVWEWCENLRSESGSSRVLRGGSWLLNAHYCRSSNRHDFVPSPRGSDIGFRLCRELSS